MLDPILCIGGPLDGVFVKYDGLRFDVSEVSLTADGYAEKTARYHLRFIWKDSGDRAKMVFIVGGLDSDMALDLLIKYYRPDGDCSETNHIAMADQHQSRCAGIIRQDNSMRANLTALETDPQGRVQALVIPRCELEKLEKARADLWDLAERFGFSSSQMHDLESITSVMWKLANRNWPSAV